MRVKMKIGRPKVRTVTHLLPMSGGVEYRVHNANLENTKRAILERVFFTSNGEAPPVPTVNVPERLSLVTQLFDKLKVKTAKLSEEKFLQYYSGRRLACYSKALQELSSLPLSAEDAIIKAFVKAEKVNFTTKDDPAPRIIQPRSPRFNLELGLYTKKIEPQLYYIVKRIFGERTIFKGMNALESGRCMHKKWQRYLHPVAIGLDASRFDQHVGVELLKWEHSIYKRFYPKDKRLAWLLNMQLTNRGVAHTADGSVTYKVQGCRMSGDMNTALGNCIIMCALVYTYLMERGVKASLANNGDDCVIICEQRDLTAVTDGLAEWFLAFGLTMKVEEPVYELERVSFCQTNPVWSPEGYIMVRDPINGFDKDLTSTENIFDEKSWRNACALIGECGLHLAGHMPLYGALYRKLVSVGGVADMTRAEHNGLWWLARGLDNSRAPIHPRTRVSFEAAFGILPDEQTAIEAEIDALQPKWNPGRVGLIYTPSDLNQFRW